MTPEPPQRASASAPGGLSPGTRSRLLEAWAAWDTKPGAQATTSEMVDAAELAAVELGIPAVTLRDA